MLYLKIQNPGETPIESFTTLGLSSSRNKTEKIGMFGSGGKFSITTLLRQSINPTIFIGNRKLEFFTKPKTFKEESYQQVYCNFDGEIKELGFCLEFGELDWDSIDMALRELISNAIDGSESHKNVIIDVVSETKPIEGCTVVYIPLTSEVQKYYNSLSDKFLHFSTKNKLEKSILSKSEKTQAKIYRKGVFVRQISDRRPPSLFDYNFGDELKIDEARNLNDYSCAHCAAQALSKDENAMKELIESVIRLETVWETSISCYYFSVNLKDLWRQMYGNTVITNAVDLSGLAKKKGFDSFLINSPEFYEVLKKGGVPTVYDVLSSIESQGKQIVPATSKARKTMNKVWNWLELVELTMGKEKPTLKCFNSIMDSETELCGYADSLENCVYINVDNDEDEQTMMEELAHIISGSGDISRDFQDFAFKAAVRFARKINW